MWQDGNPSRNTLQSEEWPAEGALAASKAHGTVKSFPRAVFTHYCQLGASNNLNLFSHGSRDQKSGTSVTGLKSRACSLCRPSGESPSLPLPASSSHHVHWPVATTQSPPLWPRCLLPASQISPLPFSYKDTCDCTEDPPG